MRTFFSLVSPALPANCLFVCVFSFDDAKFTHTKLKQRNAPTPVSQVTFHQKRVDDDGRLALPWRRCTIPTGREYFKFSLICEHSSLLNEHRIHANGFSILLNAINWARCIQHQGFEQHQLRVRERKVLPFPMCFHQMNEDAMEESRIEFHYMANLLPLSSWMQRYLGLHFAPKVNVLICYHRLPHPGPDRAHICLPRYQFPGYIVREAISACANRQIFMPYADCRVEQTWK